MKFLIQDGTPCHRGRRVRAIGRRVASLCEFPPRSADFTACDNFLWGYLRELVYYGDALRNLDALKRYHDRGLIKKSKSRF